MSRLLKVLSLVLILMLGVALLIGCGASKDQPGSQEQNSGEGSVADSATDVRTLRIGHISSTSGAGATVGTPQANGVEFAVKEINENGGISVNGAKYKLELITYDDKADPTEGVTVIRRLLDQDKVKFLVGTLSSGVGGAYEPILRNYNVINVVVGAALATLTDNPNIYRPRVIIPQYVDAHKTFITSQDVKTVVLFTDKQHTGFMELTDQLAQKLEDSGIKVLAKETYKFGDTDYTGQLTKIKGLNPDVINLRGYPMDAILAVKQARSLGIKSTIITGSGITKVEIESGNASKDMVDEIDIGPPTQSDLAAMGDEKAKGFVERYKAQFGNDPGFTTASAYGGVYILARAIEKAGTVDDIDKIKDVLNQLKLDDVPELVEPIIPVNDKIFDNRQASFKMVAKKWNGSDWEILGLVE